MPKGRGSNQHRTNLRKRHRSHRGTQAGTLRKETPSPTTTTLPHVETTGIQSFLESMRKRFRRRAR